MDPDTLDQRTEEMIRRRVAGGANEAESRTMLAEFLTTAGRGFLPTALHYNGFATARGAETFTGAFFAEDPATEQAADPSGMDSPPLAAAADITVEHSAEGTLVHGTSRGDQDAAQALKANGFRWSRNLDAGTYLATSRTRPATSGSPPSKERSVIAWRSRSPTAVAACPRRRRRPRSASGPLTGPSA